MSYMRNQRKKHNRRDRTLPEEIMTLAYFIQWNKAMRRSQKR